MDYSLIEALCIECGAAFERDALLSRHCSMRIGGACDILVRPNSEEMLRSLLAACRGEGIPFFLLGRGSNVLFSDEGYRGCVILLGQEMGGIAVEGNRITAGAGTALSAVCSAALENGLSGLEFAYGIPGTVGGALFMNAGAYGGEMKDVVTSCRYIDENGEFREMPAEEMNLSYRHSVFSERDFVITSVTLRLSEGDKAAIKVRMDELMQKRRDKQPLEFPSCGSTFKRPEGYFAAALIEECGLKGCTVGGAQVSEKHSGFVINRGGATSADVMELVRHIKKTVREEKGVELECEMLVVDGRP